MALPTCTALQPASLSRATEYRYCLRYEALLKVVVPAEPHDDVQSSAGTQTRVILNYF